MSFSLDTHKKQKSKRIHSYDFFQGVLVTGLIFLMTFLEFSVLGMEIFYRWASLGFLFFTGVLIGEVFIKNKNALFFVRRGIQVFTLFFLVNLASFFSHFSFEEWQDFSVLLIRGDYTLVANLLLSMGVLFFMIPLFKYIPAFLGFFWAILGFLLLDILALEKDIFYINIFFLMAGVIGFFSGRFFSLERVRIFIHNTFSFLPYVLLYIALALVALGGVFSDIFVAYFYVFWTFHLFVMILLYFSLPSLLFVGEKQKPALRKFFETLGVEVLFVYVFIAFLLQMIQFVFPEITGVHPVILAFHLVILAFGVVLLLRKIFSRSGKKSRLKQIFRFIF